MSVRTFCRLCDGACGLVAQVSDGRLVSLEGDADDPVSAGFVCEAARASIPGLSAADRVTQPLKRQGGGHVPATWDEALVDIGQRLAAARKRGGARSVGLYLGEAMQRSDRGLIRSLAAAAALGTPSVFSELSDIGGPPLRAAELALGHAVPLLPDISRAHYVLALGGDQDTRGWGPLVRGRLHTDGLAHSRRTKGTKVVVAGPRATPFARAMNQHLPIRPGTEPFLLLGMLVAVVRGGWRDAQFVRDYTVGWDRMAAALGPWTVDRCADICGIPAADLSGVALKFSRSAMSVVAPDASTFANAHASLGAWAWLALHTVTANTLRPGGLYDHKGVFDLHHALALLRTDKAPHTRATGHPLLLLQGPAGALADEVLVPGEGRVTALVTVRGDPVGRLPAPARTREALGTLDTLVCLATTHDETTALADWVLPLAHPWERADLETLGGLLLPRDIARFTPALVPPAGEARAESDVLADIVAAVSPGLGRGEWGWPVALAGRALSRGDLSSFERMAREWLREAGWDAVARDGGLDAGESDRATWRVAREDGRIDLFPDAVGALLDQADVPVDDSARPLWLRTSTVWDGARPATGEPAVRAHPDCGLVDGARVRIRTAHGEAEGTLRLDPDLRPDTVDVEGGALVAPGALLSGTRLDALTGAVERDGLRCTLDAV